MEAIREVSAAMERIKIAILDAKSEANQGIMDAIASADRDNIDKLEEMIKASQDLSAEVRSLRHQLTQAPKQ